MHKLFLLALFLASCIASIFIAPSANAISNNIVISQVQIGDVSHSRLIEFFNNSNGPVDVTDWCVYHSSATNKTENKLGCFTNLDQTRHQILSANSYMLFGTEQFDMDVDFPIYKGLGGIDGGHVYIKDSNKIEVDRLGWGSAEKAEGNLPALLSPTNTNNVLERKQDELGNYIDTDDNLSDFFNSTLRTEYLIGSISEITDICSNISGIQVLVPDGYYIETLNNCLLIPVDICSNLDGIQTALPPGYEFNGDSNCQPDICINIDGLQLILPDNYIKDVGGNCIPDFKPLKITELLPNPIGSDGGNEFIEIYNPNSIDVNLNLYILDVGINYENSYNFPIDSYINSGQYLKFTNDDIKFTLLNSSSRVRVRGVDGTMIDETPVYINPDPGISWAFINSLWQYTNQPTMGGVNLSSVIEQVEVIKLKSTLVTCKDGQYRSEETNRCRNIATEVIGLVPCAEGQERNPATNRCRSVSAVLAISDLKPCDVGQERNSETNRCRNVASMPKVDYKPEQVNENSTNNILYWSVAIIGLVAVGYGLWEWRSELLRFLRRLLKHGK